jgi:hypothetical protein
LDNAPWNYFKVTEFGPDVNVRTQTDFALNGKSLEVEWIHAKNTAGEWHLERTDNSSEFTSVMENEFYISHWIYFDPEWRFVDRWKGIKLHDRDAQGMCTGGGIWTGTKVGDSSNGYGYYYSDQQKDSYVRNLVSSTAGSVLGSRK